MGGASGYRTLKFRNVKYPKGYQFWVGGGAVLSGRKGMSGRTRLVKLEGGRVGGGREML